MMENKCVGSGEMRVERRREKVKVKVGKM